MMLTDAPPCETTDGVNAATVEDPLPYSTCDTGTQCILKPLGRSHAVQVNLKPKMVSMGTQTSTPLTSPDPTDGEDDLSVISDASWVPGDQMSEEDEEVLCEEPSQTCDPHQNGIDKFIVCQEELMALFAICPACCYATSLIEALRESYMDSPKALQEVSANLSACAPAPIAKSFEQIPKEEAVSLYLAQQSRYKKLN
ncbi:unnamed protein product [Gadus morhua 'NCC']